MIRFLAFLLMVHPVPAAFAAPETVNASVGQVGAHVVTARQVWISNYFERWALARRSTDPKLRQPRADWKPPLGSEAFTQAASSLMLEVMVSMEAENFSVAQVDESQVRPEVQEFLKAMSSNPEWLRLEVGEREAEKFIERKKRAQSFLRFKTDSAGVVVTDAEAKAYYDQNRLKFGNLPFSQFKEGIRDVLSRQILEDRLKDWFEILRRKYRVRFLGRAES